MLKLDFNVMEETSGLISARHVLTLQFVVIIFFVGAVSLRYLALPHC